MTLPNVITVVSVVEYNDCAGRKFIEVSSQGYDELMASRFRMTHHHLPPHRKLHLSSVAPGDQVVIDPEELGADPFVCGSFVELLTPPYDRDSVCRCGQQTVSDGFGVYCLDPNCPLSFLARLTRLANIPFLANQVRPLYARDYLSEGGFQTKGPYLSEICGGPEVLEYPFRPLLRPELWGKPGFRLEDILLVRDYGAVSMATFLVQDLFRDFLDHVGPALSSTDPLWTYMSEFYGLLTEVTQRRMPDDARQDHVIQCFIWALGIEALSSDVVSKMCTYEKSLGLGDDILLVYAYFLSHPRLMVQELGIHELEASAITTEFRRRRLEMIDIFTPHLTAAAMQDAFGSHRR